LRRLRIVTRGALEAFVLDKLLRPHLGEAVRVRFTGDGGGEAGPISSARSDLVDGLRVALVLNTGTLDFRKIRSRMARLEYMLGMAAWRDRWKIVLMRPEVEILFFQNAEVLRQLTGRTATPEEMERAQAHPKEVLAEMLGAPPNELLPALQQRLDAVDLRPLASQPQIRALLDFHARPPPEAWLISP
jgi:hypothetical protein